jgi:hypothetical protein
MFQAMKVPGSEKSSSGLRGVCGCEVSVQYLFDCVYVCLGF